MTQKILFLLSLTLFSPVASASFSPEDVGTLARYTFRPLPGEATGCKRLGMNGTFTFQVSQGGRLGTLVFAPSRQKIVVVPAGPDQWIMRIFGDWSEQITVSFASGDFSYSSSRPGRAGHCDATFR